MAVPTCILQEWAWETRKPFLVDWRTRCSMGSRKIIHLLNLFQMLLLSTLIIIITEEFKLKQNGCLPLNLGKHPWCKYNYSIFKRCPENWVHIRVYDSLTFFHKSAGRTDIERGIRVLQLYGKPVCHLWIRWWLRFLLRHAAMQKGRAVYLFSTILYIYKSGTISISYRKALKTSLKDDIISYYTMTGVRYAQENIIWCWLYGQRAD